MSMIKRMKPALAATAVLLTLTSTTAFAQEALTRFKEQGSILPVIAEGKATPVKAGEKAIPAKPEEKATKPAAAVEVVNADGTISLDGVVEYVDLEGGYYKVGSWSLMGDEDFADYLGKRVLVSGKEFDGMSIRMVKAIVVEQIAVKAEAEATDSAAAEEEAETGAISLDGVVEYVDLEGGFYKVGEWSLMGDQDFASYLGKEVLVSGKEFDGISTRMVKSLVVEQIALKEAAAQGSKKPAPREPVAVDGAIALEGTVEFTDLEGGFYTLDGWGLVGDEELFKALEGKQVIVRGTEFEGISIRQVKQIEVSSVMLPVSADRSLPTGITVNGSKLAAGQEPAVVDGVLMLPLRHVVEKADGKVKWDPKEQAVVVTMPDRMAYFRIGESQAEMNENNVRYIQRNMIAMEKAPIIINGRTLISADAATQILGLFEVADTNTSLDLAPLK